MKIGEAYSPSESYPQYEAPYTIDRELTIRLEVEYRKTVGLPNGLSEDVTAEIEKKYYEEAEKRLSLLDEGITRIKETPLSDEETPVAKLHDFLYAVGDSIQFQYPRVAIALERAAAISFETLETSENAQPLIIMTTNRNSASYVEDVVEPTEIYILQAIEARVLSEETLKEGASSVRTYISPYLPGIAITVRYDDSGYVMFASNTNEAVS